MTEGGNDDVKFKDKTIVEVGCGRGGGMSYIMKYLKPKKCIGMDNSYKQIEFCSYSFSDIDNLEFVTASAETFASNPYFKDIKVDKVISIESSHCYTKFR